MRNFIKTLKDFAGDETGATMVEYGLMVALVAAVAIVAVTLFGTNVTAKFNEVAGKVGSAGGG